MSEESKIKKMFEYYVPNAEFQAFYKEVKASGGFNKQACDNNVDQHDDEDTDGYSTGDSALDDGLNLKDQRSQPMDAFFECAGYANADPFFETDRKEYNSSLTKLDLKQDVSVVYFDAVCHVVMGIMQGIYGELKNYKAITFANPSASKVSAMLQNDAATICRQIESWATLRSPLKLNPSCIKEMCNALPVLKRILEVRKEIEEVLPTLDENEPIVLETRRAFNACTGDFPKHDEIKVVLERAEESLKDAVAKMLAVPSDKKETSWYHDLSYPTSEAKIANERFLRYVRTALTKEWVPSFEKIGEARNAIVEYVEKAKKKIAEDVGRISGAFERVCPGICPDIDAKDKTESEVSIGHCVAHNGKGTFHFKRIKNSEEIDAIYENAAVLTVTQAVEAMSGAPDEVLSLELLKNKGIITADTKHVVIVDSGHPVYLDYKQKNPNFFIGCDPAEIVFTRNAIKVLEEAFTPKK